jgi:hypothetical protein
VFFWVVTLWEFGRYYQGFGEVFASIFRSERFSNLKMEAAGSSEEFETVYQNIRRQPKKR